MKLLAGRVVERGLAESISPQTVRMYLKNELKPWQKQQWCIPEVSGDYVAAMEDVLDEHDKPYDPQHPVVCFDETLLKKLEFHYTPKHGSWRDRAEIEFSALSRMCLDQRTPDIDMLRREVQAWQTERNQAGVHIHWPFTTSKARETVSRCYPAQSTG